MRRIACAVSAAAVSFGLLAFACSSKDTTAAAVTPDAAPDASVDAPVLRTGPPRVLFFTKETLFFHTDAHKIGDEAVPTYLRARGHVVTVTNDAAAFTAANLANFDVTLFFVTSGNFFDDAQRADFEAFMRSGKGFVGVHSANATELESIFFRGLVGAAFGGHGVGDAGITSASLNVVDTTDPLVGFLPNPWVRTDEWYWFSENPNNNHALVHLLRIDESTLPANYPDGGHYGTHPLAWRQEYMGARSYYTALGHTGDSYKDELFLRSIALAVEWSAGPMATP